MKSSLKVARIATCTLAMAGLALQSTPVAAFAETAEVVKPPVVTQDAHLSTVAKEGASIDDNITVATTTASTAAPTVTPTTAPAATPGDSADVGATTQTTNLNTVVTTTYTLTYHYSNNPAKPKDEKREIEEGALFDAPATPSLEGYIFEGWYRGEGGTGTEWLFGADPMPSHNLDLYAKWTPKTYNFEFLANDGTDRIVTTMEVTYLKVTHLPEMPDYYRRGYTFMGWNSDKGGSGISIKHEINYVIAQDLPNGATCVMYAIWKPNTYDIVFEGGAGATGTSKNNKVQNGESIKFNQSLVLPTADNSGFTKDGYTLTGWQITKIGRASRGKVFKAGEIVEGLTTEDKATVTLEAVWTMNADPTPNPNPGTPDKPVMPDRPEIPENPETPEIPDTPGDDADGDNDSDSNDDGANESGNSSINSDSDSNSKGSTSVDSKKHLPQTGDVGSAELALGLAASGAFVAIAGIFAKKHTGSRE